MAFSKNLLELYLNTPKMKCSLRAFFAYMNSTQTIDCSTIDYIDSIGVYTATITDVYDIATNSNSYGLNLTKGNEFIVGIEPYKDNNIRLITDHDNIDSRLFYIIGKSLKDGRDYLISKNPKNDNIPRILQPIERFNVLDIIELGEVLDYF